MDTPKCEFDIDVTCHEILFVGGGGGDILSNHLKMNEWLGLLPDLSWKENPKQLFLQLRENANFKMGISNCDVPGLKSFPGQRKIPACSPPPC